MPPACIQSGPLAAACISSYRHVQVLCTGKKNRLLDCVFPESFATEDRDAYFGDYNGNWLAAAHASSVPVPIDTAPPPSIGLTSSNCDNNERALLAVLCRSFEIIGMLIICQRYMYMDQRVYLLHVLEKWSHQARVQRCTKYIIMCSP